MKAEEKVSAGAPPKLDCIMFSYQMLAPDVRKTGLIFMAESMARKGFRTAVVTSQLSWLSRLAKAARLSAAARLPLNSWISRGPNLWGFIWFPVVHPGRIPIRGLDWLTRVFARLYPYLMSREMVRAVRSADIIVVESCAAVALAGRLRRLAPEAKHIYCASDRLDAVGMHVVLSEILNSRAQEFDLIRIPSEAMAEDFPEGSNVHVLEHGIDRAVFDAATTSPYPAGTVNAVVAGDMNFDDAMMKRLVEAFPGVAFHVFGHMRLEETRANVVHHGELAFARLAPYIKFAHVGLAPYLFNPRVTYLSQSSLKLLQYTYCRLPIVAPDFVRAGRAHVFGYEPSQPHSAVAAFQSALRYDRSAIAAHSVQTWDDMMDDLLQLANLPPRPAAERSTTL